MTNATETLTQELERTSPAYRRDLLLARQVIAKLRDEAMETGTPFHVGNLALDTLWYGLDRIDTHFWHAESFHPHMESRTGTRPADRQRPWWQFWGPG